MSAAKEREEQGKRMTNGRRREGQERERVEERTNGRRRKGQGKRKVEEEERTNGRRREGQGRGGKREINSYYKWQSLPGAGLSALPGIEIPQ